MRNMGWCIYTYRHRKAFEYCVRKLVKEPGLREEMLRRARIHDMDKMLMYLFMDQPEAQKLHFQTKKHHMENSLPKTYEDLVETVIDYECAPYTKPDKPLKAFDFVHKLMERKAIDAQTGEKLIGVMRDLGIDHSSSAADDPEGMEYLARFWNVSEEMVFEEILRYVNDNPENELNEILELTGKKEPPLFTIDDV